MFQESFQIQKSLDSHCEAPEFNSHVCNTRKIESFFETLHAKAPPPSSISPSSSVIWCRCAHHFLRIATRNLCVGVCVQVCVCVLYTNASVTSESFMSVMISWSSAHIVLYCRCRRAWRRICIYIYIIYSIYSIYCTADVGQYTYNIHYKIYNILYV
jgi:hypothetical protein